MPFNVLILPLLGGFIVATELHYYRLKLARYEHKRLLFHASLFGLLLLIPAFGIVAVARVFLPSFFDYLQQYVFAFTGPELQYVGESLLSLALAVPLVRIGNSVYPENSAIVSAIKERKDPFEMLCLRSFNDGHPTMLTLKNGKVYIGWIRELTSPYESAHIAIIPLKSGYRTVEGKVALTTSYIEVYDRLSRVGESIDKKVFINRLSGATTVIPKGEIVVSTLYYPEYEEQLNTR